MATGSRHRGFIKAETLRFDTAADGPAAPAKRRHASDRHADNATAAAAPRKRHHAAHQSAASPAPGRPSAASSCHPPPQPPAAGAGAAAGGSIPSGNVGFQLLRKAGWRPGTGLGKHEHGSREPIAPPVQRSTRGVGYSAADPAPPAAAAPGAGKAAAPPGGAPALARQGRPAAAAAAAAVAAQGAAGGKRKGMGGGQAPQQDPAVASAVARQEADQRRYRAIQAALRRDFSAPTTDDGGDTNPLLRRNKLTATNPLLGDDADDW